MRTLKQIEAARRNGAKSRGPVTEDGKRTSSQNATKHGLSARHTVVLANESNDVFTRVLDAYKLQLEPRNQVEHDLVVELATARWRLRRVWDLETSLIDLELAQQVETFTETVNPPLENLRTASAFKALATGDGALSLLTRYEARIRSGFTRALRELHLLRSGKLAPSGNPGAAQHIQPALDEPAISGGSPDGVLQNEPEPSETTRAHNALE